MRRRGFTLLELAIASFLGTAVIVATMGVFAAIARADRRTAARFDRSIQLSLLQRSVQRAWDSVVMADGGVTAALDPGALDPGALDSEAAETPAEPLPPLRILLEPDPALSRLTMSRRTALGEGGGWGAGEAIAPQRLELALSAPPATESARDYRRALRLQEQGLLPVQTGPEVAADRSVRGAFEFRPEDRATAFGEQIYSLWWRPMAQAETAEELAQTDRPMDVAMAEGAVELVEEVIWARWRVFKRREWHETFRAISVPDLPAYAELEITTPEMMTASWIFEVAWTIGEDPSAEPGEAEGEGEADGEGEGGGAVGAEGGTTTQTIDGTTTIIDESGAGGGTSVRRQR